MMSLLVEYCPSLLRGAGMTLLVAALALTDGFVELPAGPADLAKGYVTRLFRW